MKTDILDRAIREIREEPLDLAAAQGAARRVWDEVARVDAGLTSGAAPGAAAPAAPETLTGCADFRALLPAYLAGTLSSGRRLLVEDHVHECVGCRKALAAARGGQPIATFFRSRTRSAQSAAGWRRLALAAGLAALVVGGGLVTWRLGGFGLPGGPVATIESIDGELFRVAGERVATASAGEKLDAEAPLRTAKGSRAVLRLTAGSRVVRAERSQLEVARRGDGEALELERGSVIVEAATQGSGHLYVVTDDCQVAVVGTIFSVNHGTAGSRVSVLEGEVRVEHGTGRAVLRPGDQVATDTRLARVALDEEFAWSRDAAAYRARLVELTALGHAIEKAVATPDLRTSTRLLDLAPAGTVVWVALPNLSGTLAEAWQMLQQRVAESPTLAQWWQESVAGRERERELAAVLEKLQLFGGELGPEIGIAAQPGRGDGVATFLAEAPRPARLATLIDEEIARQTANGHEVHLRRVTELSQLPPTGAPHEAYIWLTGGLAVASSSPVELRAVGATLAGAENPFVATPFHVRLAEAYAAGIGWLVGVDARGVIAAEAPADSGLAKRERNDLAAFGLADLDLVLLESRDGQAGTETKAALSFGQTRRGVASWLAEPAPMGALDFVSPDAHVALALVFKDPKELLEDALRLLDTNQVSQASARDKLAEFEREHGISVSTDIAAALGGELAFALDGALAPNPAWKVVIEVYDQARLERTIATLVEEWNREAPADRPHLRLSQEASGDRVYYRLAEESGKWGVEYTFVDGYLLLAPQRAILVQAIGQRAAGTTLVSSARFRALLPNGGQTHFSALAYQNLAAALGALGNALGQSAKGQAGPLAGLSMLASLGSGSGPSLAWAEGQSDRIVAGTTGTSGPLAWMIDACLAALAHQAQPAQAPIDPPAGTPATPGTAERETPARAPVRVSAA